MVLDMIPGHPHATKELDEQRARQRRWLVALPLTVTAAAQRSIQPAPNERPEPRIRFAEARPENEAALRDEVDRLAEGLEPYLDSCEGYRRNQVVDAFFEDRVARGLPTEPDLFVDERRRLHRAVYEDEPQVLPDGTGEEDRRRANRALIRLGVFLLLAEETSTDAASLASGEVAGDP